MPHKVNRGSSFPALEDPCCRLKLRAGAWAGSTEKIQHCCSGGRVSTEVLVVIALDKS